MFINLLLVVALQVFQGNSGLGNFGQYTFVTIGAYASIWFSLSQQEKKRRCRICRKVGGSMSSIWTLFLPC